VDVLDTVIVLDTELVTVWVTDCVVNWLTVTEAERDADTDAVDESEAQELPEFELLCDAEPLKEKHSVDE
jgi:hypothetical protein